jgi:hypothetical protein
VDVIQVIEHVFIKFEALSSKPSTTKKKEEKEEEEETCMKPMVVHDYNPSTLETEAEGP